jgi:hypothetical protein
MWRFVAPAVVALAVVTMVRGADSGAEPSPAGGPRVGPTGSPTPTPTPTPAPTDTVTLRPVGRRRGSGTVDVDRGSGWFTVRLQGIPAPPRNRAHAVWVRRRPEASHCRIGFLASSEGSGQLPSLPPRARFLVTLERSEHATRPGTVLLRGRSSFRIRSTAAARDVCRRR